MQYSRMDTRMNSRLGIEPTRAEWAEALLRTTQKPNNCIPASQKH